MEIYHKSNSRKKGVLREILLGGVWTRELAWLTYPRLLVPQNTNAGTSGKRCSIYGGIVPPLGIRYEKYSQAKLLQPTWTR